MQNISIPVSLSTASHFTDTSASPPVMKSSLGKLVDKQILENLSNLVKTERKLTLQILHYLAEVEARRLFAREGYPSLFAFCTERLGYTEGAAMRRINAMRLLSIIPEAESKIVEGKINLTQLSQIKQMQSVEEKQTSKKFSKEETLKLLGELEGKSTRETDRLLIAQSPALEEKKRREEKIKPVSANLTSITLTADQDLTQLIEQARSMLANNQNMNPSLSELFKQSLKAWIFQKQIKRGDIRKANTNSSSSIQNTVPNSSADRKPKSVSRSPLASIAAPAPVTAPPSKIFTSKLASSLLLITSGSIKTLAPKSNAPKSTPRTTPAPAVAKAQVPAPAPAVAREKISAVVDKIPHTKGTLAKTLKRNRYIPNSIKRALYQRAQGQCEYRTNNLVKERCQSKHPLEIHHIQPFAKQGSNDINNLEIRCHGHNEAQSVWDFGLKQR